MIDANDPLTKLAPIYLRDFLFLLLWRFSRWFAELKPILGEPLFARIEAMIAGWRSWGLESAMERILSGEVECVL